MAKSIRVTLAREKAEAAADACETECEAIGKFAAEEYDPGGLRLAALLAETAQAIRERLKDGDG